MLSLSKAELPAFSESLLLFPCLKDYQGESVLLCLYRSVEAFSCYCDTNMKSWHCKYCRVAESRRWIPACDPAQDHIRDVWAGEEAGLTPQKDRLSTDTALYAF